MSNRTIAERMHDGFQAECDIEEKLSDAGVEFERIGSDYYDNSLELFQCPPEQRLTPEQQKIVFDAGFSIVYVNHTDDWETHYSWKHTEPFKPSDGWRTETPEGLRPRGGKRLARKK